MIRNRQSASEPQADRTQETVSKSQKCQWDISLVVLLGLRYSKGIAIWKQVLESQNKSKRNLAMTEWSVAVDVLDVV